MDDSSEGYLVGALDIARPVVVGARHVELVQERAHGRGAVSAGEADGLEGEGVLDLDYTVFDG